MSMPGILFTSASSTFQVFHLSNGWNIAQSNVGTSRSSMSEPLHSGRGIQEYLGLLPLYEPEQIETSVRSALLREFLELW